MSKMYSWIIIFPLPPQAKRARGERGKYFLENFADVPDEAILVAENKEFLTINYEGPFESVVEIEMDADRNGIVKKL